MKQVVSRHPYESSDSSIACLKTEGAAISRELVSQLQERVNVCGARITNFDLNEISYASEIAAGMLRRQQADALVAARSVIVNGAVQIAQSAVSQLEAAGTTMDPAQRAHLITNLLTVIVSDREPMPTVAM